MTRCPRPEKIPYRSRDEVKQLLRRSKALGGKNLRPYHCECGAWHVTSQSRSAKRHGSERVARRAA